MKSALAICPFIFGGWCRGTSGHSGGYLFDGGIYSLSGEAQAPELKPNSRSNKRSIGASPGVVRPRLSQWISLALDLSTHGMSCFVLFVSELLCLFMHSILF